MTQREFNHLLSSLKELSSLQLKQLRRELDHELALNGGDAKSSGESAFDVLDRAGLIGCIKGAPRSPSDLSTNPRHMERFGLE
jgi:hypothetical protein